MRISDWSSDVCSSDLVFVHSMRAQAIGRHGLEPPFGELFAWLDGRADRPDPEGKPVFRPPMLAHPLEDEEVAGLDFDAFLAEWKWDGIRVQVVSRDGERRLDSRTGDDIDRKRDG